MCFVFLVPCSHPLLNSPVHERHSQMKLSFLALVVLKFCGCKNKVCDLKKVVTYFLRYLTGCILTSCSDCVCGGGGWEGEWFSLVIPRYSPSKAFGLGRASLTGPLTSSWARQESN